MSDFVYAMTVAMMVGAGIVLTSIVTVVILTH